MLRYKLYRNLEELPIFNWFKVQSENDVRFLLDLKSYSKLPTISKYLQRDLIIIYKNMVGSLKAKSRLITAKHNIIELLIKLVLDIAANSKDAKKIEKASTIIRALMIDPNHPELLKNVDFLETPEQRSVLTFIHIAIKKYQDKLSLVEINKKQTLYDQVAIIESGLNGINIDVHKCSVNQYMAYSKQLRIQNNVN